MLVPAQAFFRQKSFDAYLLCFVSAFLLAVGYLAFQAGFGGGFLFDDEANIERNANIAIESLAYDELSAAAWSGISGPLKRPISMISFAVNYHFNGLDPYYFKVTNFFIHALNALGLAVLAWLLFRSPAVNLDRNARMWICTAVAAVWFLHPLNLTPVLYVVQRMTSLATLFACGGVICYVVGRLRQTNGHRGWPWILIGVPCLTVLAMLSKETGALVPLFCFVVELTLFGGAALDRRGRLLASVFFAISIGVPALFFFGYLATHPGWLESLYSGRDFSLIERLLTQPRVVMWYLRMILVPNISEMGLLLDDIAISHSLLDPVTTLPSIVATIALIVLAFAARKSLPLLSFGILWFFCGHVLESTVWPLELAYEHRNYLPSFGPIIAVFYYLLRSATRLTPVHARKIAAAAIIGLLAVSTHSRAQTWRSPAYLALAEVIHHPASPRNNYFAGRYLAAMARQQPANKQSELIDSAHAHYETALTLNPRMAAAQIALICLYLEFDRSPLQSWLDNLRNILAEHKPPLASTLNAMRHLTDCASSYPHALPRESYLELVSVLLDNPTTSPRGRSLVSSFVLDYKTAATH